VPRGGGALGYNQFLPREAGVCECVKEFVESRHTNTSKHTLCLVSQESNVTYLQVNVTRRV